MSRKVGGYGLRKLCQYNGYIYYKREYANKSLRFYRKPIGQGTKSVVRMHDVLEILIKFIPEEIRCK